MKGSLFVWVYFKFTIFVLGRENERAALFCVCETPLKVHLCNFTKASEVFLSYFKRRYHAVEYGTAEYLPISYSTVTPFKQLVLHCAKWELTVQKHDGYS